MSLSDLKTLVNATGQNISQFKALTAAYELFGFGVPTIKGYTDLIGNNNATNFGSYSSYAFNDENIYINSFVNLYQGNNEGRAVFDKLIESSFDARTVLITVYQQLVPIEMRSTEGREYFLSQQDFFVNRAAEFDFSPVAGVGVVGAAALMKILVDQDIKGRGDAVVDLLAAVNNGTAQIPQSGEKFTNIEIADGSDFDADDDPDDYPASISTDGVLVIGSTSTGVFEKAGDVDWFAVQLEANQRYGFLGRGAHSNSGTAESIFVDLLDAEGHVLVSTPGANTPTGPGWEGAVGYTTTEAGTYYVAAKSAYQSFGTYEVGAFLL
ncbi:hypothetical protein GJW-30_1_00074 [Variibacter gotjawalensis]|uniref:Uncharacterized protein n=1 Tax=Variibacter gotjawalensis TaxID=1333996 RepID=A0A0S3PNX1_9BRAD|nr:hypothetical protein [Variibacter gotjawalensis]NIK47853.1 hypothetical protein [Variibacter gotjawalensis]RZS49740.1 hypothetical protein EV661_2180 [Variibacter gotjawalensis]BAT57568.1 hypothetical protein GJW-30_1_00074 [Variibacter gotjawalensis]